MPSYPSFAVLLVPTGAAALVFSVANNSFVQLGADPQMRGRVMALYFMCFMGGTPVGAPVIGWISEHLGRAVGADPGGAVCVVAGAGAPGACWPAAAGCGSRRASRHRGCSCGSGRAGGRRRLGCARRRRPVADRAPGVAGRSAAEAGPEYRSPPSLQGPGGDRGHSAAGDRRHRRRRRRPHRLDRADRALGASAAGSGPGRGPPPDAGRRPLQVVAADVRRLGRQIALVPAGAPMARRRALAAAYEDVLIEAAVLLEVPNDLRDGARRPRPRRRAAAAAGRRWKSAGLAVHA